MKFEPKDSSSGIHYSWNFGDGNSDTVNIHPTHVYPNNTIYVASLSVRNSSGCTKTFKDTVNLIITDMETISQPGFNARIYPNPFKDITNISYTLEDESSMQIIVYDVFGQTVANLVDNIKQKPGNYSYQLDASNYNLTAGVYLVKIKKNDIVIDKRILRIK